MNAKRGANWTLYVEATTSAKGAIQTIITPVKESYYGQVRDLILSSAPASIVVAPVPQDEIDKIINKVTKGKCGLEIGGPSVPFMRKGIYHLATSTDMINFSEDTLWGKFKDGSTFEYEKGGSGTVHITDGLTLTGIKMAFMTLF
jgi:hypothetical protein